MDQAPPGLEISPATCRSRWLALALTAVVTLPSGVSVAAADEEAEKAALAAALAKAEATTRQVDRFIGAMNLRYGRDGFAGPARNTVAALAAVKRLAENDPDLAGDLAVDLGDLVNGAWRYKNAYAAQLDWVSVEPEIVAKKREEIARKPSPIAYVREQRSVLEGFVNHHRIEGARPYPANTVARYDRASGALIERMGAIRAVFDGCLMEASQRVALYLGDAAAARGEQRELDIQAEQLRQRALATADVRQRADLNRQSDQLRRQAYDAYELASRLISGQTEVKYAAFLPCFERIRFLLDDPVVTVFPTVEEFGPDCELTLVYRCVRRAEPVIELGEIEVQDLELVRARSADEVTELLRDITKKERSAWTGGGATLRSKLGLKLGGEAGPVAAETGAESEVEAGARVRASSDREESTAEVRKVIVESGIATDSYRFAISTTVTGQSLYLVREIHAHEGPGCPPAVPAPTRTSYVVPGSVERSPFRQQITIVQTYFPQIERMPSKGIDVARDDAKSLFASRTRALFASAMELPPPRGLPENVNVDPEASDCDF